METGEIMIKKRRPRRHKAWKVLLAASLVHLGVVLVGLGMVLMLPRHDRINWGVVSAPDAIAMRLALHFWWQAVVAVVTDCLVVLIAFRAAQARSCFRLVMIAGGLALAATIVNTTSMFYLTQQGLIFTQFSQGYSSSISFGWWDLKDSALTSLFFAAPTIGSVLICCFSSPLEADDGAISCPECGYDLRGNPQTTECPECGAKVIHVGSNDS